MPTFQLERNGRVLGNHVLDSGVVTIGRSRDNTIAIANSAVSRYHARIEHTADGHALTDLGSLNGTYVNGERIKRVLLSDNDRIEIGDYAIVFTGGSSAAPSLSPPSTTDGETGGDAEERRPNTETREMHETSVIAGSADDGGKHIEVLPDPLESAVHQMEEDPSAVVLRLRGTIGDPNAKVLIDIFDDIIGSGPYNVIVDLSDVASISSTGWGTLLGQQSRLAELDRGMKLAGVHEDLSRRFRTLPFCGFFSCYPTVNDAVAAFHTDAFAQTQVPRQEDAQPQASTHPAGNGPQTVVLNTVPSEGEPRYARQQADNGPSKATMSLEDKIRCVISERPFQSEQDIRSRLRDDEYGNTGIGRFKLKSTLKKLGLNSKLKRYQFFLRS